jgi:hypothetical protein
MSVRFVTSQKSFIFIPSAVLRFSTSTDGRNNLANKSSLRVLRTHNKCNILRHHNTPASKTVGFKVLSAAPLRRNFVTLSGRGCHRFYAKTASVTFPTSVALSYSTVYTYPQRLNVVLSILRELLDFYHTLHTNKKVDFIYSIKISRTVCPTFLPAQ